MTVATAGAKAWRLWYQGFTRDFSGGTGARKRKTNALKVPCVSQYFSQAAKVKGAAKMVRTAKNASRIFVKRSN